jgi:type I restriction enzyme S subunit
MSATGETIRLGDVCRVEHGYAFKGADMEEGDEGPIVVNIGNFRYNGGFRFESTRIQRTLSPYPQSYELSPGDVLLIMTCQTPGGEILGVPGRVPRDGITYLHNQRLGKVVVTRPECVDIDYLYFLFLSQSFNQHLRSTATGAKILHTAPTRIEDYRFAPPAVDAQKRVGRLLRTVDDFIDNNRRRIRMLDETSRLAWSHWRSHAEGVTKPLGTVVRLVRDQADPREIDGGTVYVGLEHIPRRSLSLQEHGVASEVVSAKTVFQKGDILFGKIRPYFHKVVPAPFVGVASNDAVVMRALDPDDEFASLMCVSSDAFVAEISQSANGAKMPRADWRVMASYPVPLGTPAQRRELNNLVKPQVELMQTLSRRNATLRKLRDLLLPKLLSGEIDPSRLPLPPEEPA